MKFGSYQFWYMEFFWQQVDLNDEKQMGENGRGDDEKKDNERDELSHKGGKSHVHGAQPEWLGPVGELAKYQMGFVQFATKLNICFKLPGEHINVRLGSEKRWLQFSHKDIRPFL